MTGPRIVVLGDTFVDRDVLGDAGRLCPDGPAPVVDVRSERSRAGGAGLAAWLAADQGAATTLVTALAADAGGEELRAWLDAKGVEVIAAPLPAPTPEKLRVRSAGQTLLRLDRCPPASTPRWTADELAVLGDADAIVVADYGRRGAAAETARHTLHEVARRRPVVWDPHPAGPPPVTGAWLVTPNQCEVGDLGGSGRDAAPLPLLCRRAAALRMRWQARAVAVTLGAQGALLATSDAAPFIAPAPLADARSDACGAGDAFAVAAGIALARGALLTEATEHAVRSASAFVAAGAAGALPEAPAGRRQRTEAGRPALEVAREVQAAGGAVVAAGGCFDLLHEGHRQLLRQARSLGDALIVCLNSDRSVRRLKGEGRPARNERERAAALMAMDEVDAVELFEEDVPDAVLERLRPDVFVKGGDYSGRGLPEARLLARWGGQMVVLPYLSGYSTTQILQEAAHG